MKKSRTSILAMGIKECSVAVVRTLAVGAAIALVTGCSAGLDRFDHRTVKQAPVSDDEAGVVVVDASTASIAQFLDRYPEVVFRPLVVTDNSSVVEFFGVDEATVRDEFDLFKVFKNRVLQTIDSPRLDAIAAFEHYQGIDVPEVRQQVYARPEQLEDSTNVADQLDPSTCLRSSIYGPNAVITQTNASLADSNRDYVTLGEEVVINSASSAPAGAVGGALKRAWLMIPPDGSMLTPIIVQGNEIRFTPDMVGLYQIGLIVQDKNMYCDAETELVLTTSSPELVDASTANVPFTLNESLFPHAADLALTQTWTVATGVGKVIAIIDSGVNYNHPGLRKNILVNTADPVNGRDDDHNGFVDDNLGYDFAHGDRYPYDDVGHGTMVAGLAASSWIGVAKNAKILAVKASHKYGSDVASLVASLRYAISRHADVINLSMGFYGRAPRELLAEFERAERAGIVVVAASGNGDQNGTAVDTDVTPHVPSALPNSNIISVAARDQHSLIASYSNYGKVSVDLVALGGSPDFPVRSTYLPNPQGKVFTETQGTSFAAPLISGAVAAVLELKPRLTPSEVRAVLLGSGREEELLRSKIASGRVFELAPALASVQRPPRRP